MRIYRNMLNRHQPDGKAGPQPPPNGRPVAMKLQPTIPVTSPPPPKPTRRQRPDVLRPEDV